MPGKMIRALLSYRVSFNDFPSGFAEWVPEF
jgi:hypothetical protein